MKASLLLALLLVGLLLGACGGASTVQEPPQLSDGRQAISKGVAWYQKGCYRNALDQFLSAHELFSATDQSSGVAMSLNNLGNVYRLLGDPETAHLFLDEALALYTDLADAQGAARAMSNKAAVLIDQGRLEAAARVLDQAAPLTAPGQPAFAALLNNRGILLTRQGAYAEAENVLRQALAASAPSDAPQQATALFAMGSLMRAAGTPQKAIPFFEQALEADRNAGFFRGVADDLAALGALYSERRDPAAAARHFQRSIKIYALLGNSDRVQALTPQLEDAAREADIDLQVTSLFTERWLQGNRLEPLCR